MNCPKCGSKVEGGMCSVPEEDCGWVSPLPMDEFKLKGPFGIVPSKFGGFRVVGPYNLDTDFNEDWVARVDHEELVKNIANELNEAWERRNK